jgi:hypothetical protein
MLPLAIAYIVVIAFVVLAMEHLGVPHNWQYGAVLIAVNVVCSAIVFEVLDRGRLVSPASHRLRAQELARLRAIAVRGHRAPAQGD